MRSTPLITLFFVIAGCAASPANDWSPPWKDRETLIAAYLPMQDLSEDVPNRYEEWTNLLARTATELTRIEAAWNESHAPVGYHDFEALWDQSIDDSTDEQLGYARFVLDELLKSGLLEEIDSFADTRRLHPPIDDVKWDTLRNIQVQTPKQQLFRASRACMMLSARDGDWPDTQRWLDRCLILASISALTNESLDVLIAIGYRSGVLRNLLNMMHLHDVPRDSLVRFREVLTDIDYRHIYRRTVILSAVIAIPELIAFEDFLKDPPPEFDFALALIPELEDAKSPSRRQFSRVQGQFNRFANTILRASRMPGVEGLNALPKEDVTVAIDPHQAFSEDFNALFEVNYNAYRRMLENICREESAYKATHIAIALHLYVHDHNEFPETLDALVPAYLDELPVDHFAHDGRFRYTKSDDPEVGFTLYSVGRDREDRGGRWSNDWYYPPGAYPRD